MKRNTVKLITAALAAAVSFLFISDQAAPYIFVAAYIAAELADKYLINPIRKNLELDGMELGMEIDGHRLYVFKPHYKMRMFRALSCMIAYHQLDLGMKSMDVMAYAEAGIESCDKGSITNNAQLWARLKMQAESYGSERVLMQIAGAGILVDGEPLHHLTEKHNKLKEDLLRKHPDVRVFFLKSLHVLLKQLGTEIEQSSLDGLVYNQKRRIQERLFCQLISTYTYADLWNATTTKSLSWQSKLAEYLRRNYLDFPYQNMMNTSDEHTKKPKPNAKPTKKQKENDK